MQTLENLLERDMHKWTVKKIQNQRSNWKRDLRIARPNTNRPENIYTQSTLQSTRTDLNTENRKMMCCQSINKHPIGEKERHRGHPKEHPNEHQTPNYQTRPCSHSHRIIRSWATFWQESGTVLKTIIKLETKAPSKQSHCQQCDCQFSVQWWKKRQMKGWVKPINHSGLQYTREDL